jgi:hypothetical protein
VLPDRDFVQMPGVAPSKFKSSVAGALHLSADKVPNWNIDAPAAAAAARAVPLPLTAGNAAGFNPLGKWELGHDGR